MHHDLTGQQYQAVDLQAADNFGWLAMSVQDEVGQQLSELQGSWKQEESLVPFRERQKRT